MGTHAKHVTEEVERRHARLLAYLFRARMPYGMLAFLALTGLAGIPELSLHPERAPTYAMVYAMEAQVWLLALVVMRGAGLSYTRTVTAGVLTALVMIGLSTAYHVTTGAAAETLLVSLSCVTVCAMVVFPWRALPQLLTACAAVLAFIAGVSLGIPVTSSFAIELAGLSTIAATTVVSVTLAEQYRLRVFRLASIMASRAAWRRQSPKGLRVIVGEPSF